VSRQALDELEQQIPLLDYLQAQDWRPAKPLRGGRWMGLCPLHANHSPSFLVDPGKNLFHCYGCGRGGDVIRFAEHYHQVKFPQALMLLRQWRGLAPLRLEVVGFYRMQLCRHAEAIAYLHQRGVRSPELIEHMRIGYAPGGCLRGWLTQSGYTLAALHQAGVITAAGYDAYSHRIVFPLEGNLYAEALKRQVFAVEAPLDPAPCRSPSLRRALVAKVRVSPSPSGSDSQSISRRARRFSKYLASSEAGIGRRKFFWLYASLVQVPP
jgi:hypothetical protein